MKKQKKFTGEAQIIKAIDDKRTKVPVLLAEADELEKEGKPMLENGNSVIREVGGDKVGDAARKRRSAFLIEQKHLPALKRTLAAFRTETMPFVSDNSVVLEK